jgi:hypothetical protein
MSECKKSDWTWLYIVAIYVGFYMFLYGFIKNRATKWSTRAVGWIATWAILISATMMLYDRSMAKPRAKVVPDGMVVKVSKANIRSAPTTRSKDNIVGKASRGEKLDVIGRQKRWVEIRYKDATAWVHRSVVRTGYKVIPATWRWPNLTTAMIIFWILYFIALISAIREERALYRAMAEL